MTSAPFATSGRPGEGVKVLVVDDDMTLSRFLVRVLLEEGFSPEACANGADAVERTLSRVYEVVILDWMLPDLDGISVCRRLRQEGLTIPIFMLTSRGETRDLMLAIETGADEYLVKPFEVEEFVARLRALVRRAYGTAVGVGGLVIHPMDREARLLGRRLDLTAREYAVLLDLVHHANKIVSRSDLFTRVWGNTFDSGGSNLVEVHVSRLRDKLGRRAWMIETVRGAGYRLTATRPAR